MCLIAVAWQAHPRWRLVLAGNRDEFHARPTLPLAPWAENPRILGGRDLEHGGGWLALRGTRLAAVTNVRRLPSPEGRSRGALVADFLHERSPLHQSLAGLEVQATEYRAFNLLLHDGERLAMASNLPDPHPALPPDADARDGMEVDADSDAITATVQAARAMTAAHAATDPRSFALRMLAPGVHGLSNGALDGVWPKTARLQAALDAWLHSPAAARNAPDVAPLFDALADTTRADDHTLPHTGIGLERERWLSSAFIQSPQYGTRASTVVLIADDHAWIHERRFAPDGTPAGETRLRSVG